MVAPEQAQQFSADRAAAAAPRRRGLAGHAGRDRMTSVAANRATRVYAGAGYWVSGKGERCSGGLFRRHAGEGEWERLAAGLPANVEARAFDVHPRAPDVQFAGTL